MPSLAAGAQLRRWPALPLVAGVVLLVGCSSAAPVRLGDSRPPEHLAVRASISTPAPPSPSAAIANPPPLTGPDVSTAQLFAAGRGYLRTAQSLLWTDNRGVSWRNITPAGLTAAQLQSAAIAMLPDGHGVDRCHTGAGQPQP